MSVQPHHMVIDAHDLPGLGRFRATALRWEVLSVKEREVVVGPSPDSPVGPGSGTARALKPAAAPGHRGRHRGVLHPVAGGASRGLGTGSHDDRVGSLPSQ